jgi:hypothetical protein
VDLSAYNGASYNTYLNGSLFHSFVATGNYTFNGLADGDLLQIQAVPEPSPVFLALGGAGLILLLRQRKKAT